MSQSEQRRISILRSAVTAVQSLFFFLLIIISAEYLLTERFLVLKRIPIRERTLLLLGVFFLIAVMNFRKRKPGKIVVGIWATLLLIMVVANSSYSRYYQHLQMIPKIFSMSDDWSIQGKSIKIDGINFGQSHQKGAVRVNDLEFIIKKWSDEEIVIQQPVPERFFSGSLIIEKSDGNVSDPIEFEIRDPATLHQ